MIHYRVKVSFGAPLVPIPPYTVEAGKERFLPIPLVMIPSHVSALFATATSAWLCLCDFLAHFNRVEPWQLGSILVFF